jgi:BlaI family penicillinase repressor
MARPVSSNPTDRELDILKVLWSADSASLSEVRAALSRDREVAATTIATLLKIMADKGLVQRTDDRRWRAVVSRDAAGQGLVDRLLSRVFDGSAQRLVAHVVESHALSPAELDELQELLEQHRASQRSNPRTRKLR